MFDNPTVLAALIIGGMSIIGGLIYVGLREDRERDPLQERLAQYGDREMPESLEEIELSLSFRDRVLIPVMQNLANLTVRFTPQKQLETTRHQLELAGLTTEPTTFFAQRIMLTVMFGGLGALVASSARSPALTLKISAPSMSASSARRHTWAASRRST
jgi:hypothetical protein